MVLTLPTEGNIQSAFDLVLRFSLASLLQKAFAHERILEREGITVTCYVG